MKAILPWLCIAALGVGLGALYLANQNQSIELAKLREESQELQKLRASAEETKSAQAQSENEELTRLRKEHEDLLRLRNEIRQLRDEKAQLNKQLQTAQTQAQSAQAQAQSQAARVTVSQLSTTGGAVLTPEQQASVEAMRQRYGLTTQAMNPEQIKVAGCQLSLRQIEGAKAQWALEKNRPTGGLVGETDLAPYLPGNAMPKCPAGGTYTINPVGIAPICTVQGHVLPK